MGRQAFISVTCDFICSIPSLRDYELIQSGSTDKAELQDLQSQESNSSFLWILMKAVSGVQLQNNDNNGYFLCNGYLRRFCVPSIIYITLFFPHFTSILFFFQFRDFTFFFS